MPKKSKRKVFDEDGNPAVMGELINATLDNWVDIHRGIHAATMVLEAVAQDPKKLTGDYLKFMVERAKEALEIFRTYK